MRNLDLEQAVNLLSVNLGQSQSYDPKRPEKTTGIFKLPVQGPVWLGQEGVRGDAVVNTKHHGGPGQAVYLYSEEDYAWWEREGIATFPGLFGENLTVSGIESASLCAGDRLRIGEVELEITAPRVPCATFAAKMGDPGWVKRFRDACRPGAYARVIVEGAVAAGQGIALRAAENRSMTLGAQFNMHYDSRPARDRIEMLLTMPVAEREREHYEAMRARLYGA